jgi:hypothetical protein
MLMGLGRAHLLEPQLYTVRVVYDCDLIRMHELESQNALVKGATLCSSAVAANATILAAPSMHRT